MHLAREPSLFYYSTPYPRYCGGVMLVTTQLYRYVNGHSNKYRGNTGVDDDFCLRIMRKVGISLEMSCYPHLALQCCSRLVLGLCLGDSGAVSLWCGAQVQGGWGTDDHYEPGCAVPCPVPGQGKFYVLEDSEGSPRKAIDKRNREHYDK